MTTITPFLWFDSQAEEAANFYTTLFKNSTIDSVSRYGKEGPGPEGTVMVITFHLDGQPFMALNGGKQFTFSPATSFMVNCDTQQEIDHFWEKLSDGGSPQQCGWVTDKYGVTWQIVPSVMGNLMSSGDAERSARVMHAMLQMVKLDIKELQDAYAG